MTKCCLVEGLTSERITTRREASGVNRWDDGVAVVSIKWGGEADQLHPISHGCRPCS